MTDGVDRVALPGKLSALPGKLSTGLGAGCWVAGGGNPLESCGPGKETGTQLARDGYRQACSSIRKRPDRSLNRWTNSLRLGRNGILFQSVHGLTSDRINRSSIALVMGRHPPLGDLVSGTEMPAPLSVSDRPGVRVYARTHPGLGPYDCQIYVNGREWLARQLDKAKVSYVRYDCDDVLVRSTQVVVDKSRGGCGQLIGQYVRSQS
jgi:hypothetical protein